MTTTAAVTTKGQLIEVRFSAIPGERARGFLKASGFRWDPARRCWWGATSAEKAESVAESIRQRLRQLGYAEPGAQPAAQTAAKTASQTAVRPAARPAVRTNRKPDACGKCGQWLEAGQGRLVFCPADTGCPIHHDDDGWHVYCLDEAACAARIEAQRERERQTQAVAAEIAAAIGEPDPSVAGVAADEVIARVGSLNYPTIWAVVGGRPYVRITRPDPWGEGYGTVENRPVAVPVERLREAAQLGALSRVRLPARARA